MNISTPSEITPRKRNRIVAFVDILGASQATLDGKTDDLIANIFRLKRTLNWKHRVHLKGADDEVKKTLEFAPGVAQFSDCLLLWSDPLDGLSTEDFVRTAGSFLWNFCAELGRLILADVPFRAGVSEGPVFIYPELDIYAGRPIVEAAKLESSQSWLGAAMLFSDSSDRLIHRPDQIFGSDDVSIFEHYVINVVVPIKSDAFEQCAAGQVCALNWALGVQECPGLHYADLRKKLLDLEVKAGEKAKNKYKLANEFLDEVQLQFPEDISVIRELRKDDGRME